MKMTRRELRESIFLLLFRIEFNTREELEEQLEDYYNNLESEEDTNYIHEKLMNILDRLSTIDEKIMEICKGWRLSRLGKAELAILRLAVYEILYDEEIPTGVAINEAVNIGKVYCSEEAPRFINGVLAKLA